MSSPMEGQLDLGPCCSCEKTGLSVRNIITLPQRAPVPGTGWGCFQCGLPSDGAIAVLCDACMEASLPIRFVCIGQPSNGKRVPIETSSKEIFDHDPSKHPEEIRLPSMPDESLPTNNSHYAGSGWIQSALKVEEMSSLGAKVADVLGDVFCGIYHLDYGALKRVDWSNTHHIVFVLSHRPLSTIDSDELTRLVVLSHDRLLRCQIEGAAPKSLRILFHQRKSRTGTVFERCPTLEKHCEGIRRDCE